MNPEPIISIPVRVQARASKSEILGVVDGRLKIRTTAPPTDGLANKDVIRQLAKAFHVPPSRIALKNGASARNKTFNVDRPRVYPDWLQDIAFR
jgi:uncharacterized protein (TIGR00251 family)